MGMDDPIEVVRPDARLYPIFDEAGAATLQAIIGEDGQLLARGLTTDPMNRGQGRSCRLIPSDIGTLLICMHSRAGTLLITATRPDYCAKHQMPPACGAGCSVVRRMR